MIGILMKIILLKLRKNATFLSHLTTGKLAYDEHGYNKRLVKINTPVRLSSITGLLQVLHI